MRALEAHLGADQLVVVGCRVSILQCHAARVAEVSVAQRAVHVVAALVPLNAHLALGARARVLAIAKVTGWVRMVRLAVRRRYLSCTAGHVETNKTASGSVRCYK